MSGPKIKTRREPVDWIIEAIGMAAVVVMMALPLVYYRMLPDLIPSHFNITGKPDAFSGKATVWVLPVAGLVLYTGLTILNKYPHLYNYPVKVTEENASGIYKYAVRALRIMNSVLACVFCYIVNTIIQIATGHQVGLGKNYLFFIIAGILTPVIWFIYELLRIKK